MRGIITLAAGMLCLSATAAYDQTTRAALPHTRIVLTKATIEGGQLVIEGTTPAAGTKVTIDGLFNVTSNASRVFKFATGTYRPDDCIVDLKTTAGTDQAVIALCGPRGVSFTGPWKAATNYLADDLVTDLGTTWRARGANRNKRPTSSGGSVYWEVFAQKGDTGAAGPTGLQGATGAEGPQGSQGIQGIQGIQGEPGEAGAQGIQGVPGHNNIMTVRSLSGAISSFSATGAWLFRGTVTNITLTDGQRVTGSAAASFSATGLGGSFRISLCYQPSGGAVTPFSNINVNVIADNTGEIATNVGETIGGLTAGSYDFGFCVWSQNAATFNSSGLKGWVLVTSDTE